MKKIYRFIVFCIMLAVSFFADDDTQAQASVRLNQTNATICVGGKTVLEVVGTSKHVKWSTSDKNVAKVGSAGVVTGIRKGVATITAKADSFTCKCRVVVNATYGAAVSDVTIKRETPVMLTFTKNAVVSYKIQDPDICSAGWGSWSGNEIPLNITPKKVGVTYITCTNGANTESVRIRVRVKKVPVNITNFYAAASDGGDLICGENTAKITFRQDRASKNTVLYLISRSGEIIRTQQIGPVPARKNYSVSWNGKDDKGARYEGEFRLKVVADGYTTRNWHYYQCYAKSPFLRGTGTRENPYEVARPEHLERMADFPDKHFIQVQDIDLRSEIISNIFSAEHPFMGSYNAKPQESVFRILNYNGNTSLFGVIGVEGELNYATVLDARITGTGQKRSAVMAEINQGLLMNCAVEQAVIYSASATDAALMTVENSGVIDRCRAHGTIYTYGCMAGGAVYNEQRMIRTKVEADLNLTAGEISSSEELYVGGVAAVNGQAAFIDACESNSSIQAAGTLQTPARLYMGGIVGKNAGQVRDGSSLALFPLEYTTDLIGEAQGGMIAGENNGMITGVTYYETVGRKSSATGSGREESLHPLENHNEEG
uniref:BIG2 domain-containing protein n=1 Tax=Eubacterium plexicaudatum ASF492 TaxID=1235802 RepID=N2AD68_9FIRM